MINVVPSPVKQRTSQALAPVESRKRGRVSWDDDDGNGPPPPVLLTDMSGMTFVVSKYNTQLLGVTRSILLRSVTLRADRFRWFPMAFSMGWIVRMWRYINNHPTFSRRQRTGSRKPVG